MVGGQDRFQFFHHGRSSKYFFQIHLIWNKMFFKYEDIVKAPQSSQWHKVVIYLIICIIIIIIVIQCSMWALLAQEFTNSSEF